MEKDGGTGKRHSPWRQGCSHFRASARTGAPRAPVWAKTPEAVNKHFVNFASELYKLSIDRLYLDSTPDSIT